MILAPRKEQAISALCQPMMLNDGGNNNDPLLVEALPPSTAMNVNLNGIVDSPRPIAGAAGSADVETFQSHEVEHEQRHAGQHPQDQAKGRSLSQLELVFAMGVKRYFANYSDTCGID